MMTLIIIAVVVVIAIGFLKGLRAEDRGAIIRSTVKGTAQAVSYTAKTVKVTTQLAYTTGNNMGLSMEVEAAEQLKVVRDWESANTKPVQDGIKAATKHLTELGVVDALNSAKTTNKELTDKLATL